MASQTRYDVARNSQIVRAKLAEDRAILREQYERAVLVDDKPAVSSFGAYLLIVQSLVERLHKTTKLASSSGDSVIVTDALAEIGRIDATRSELIGA